MREFLIGAGWVLSGFLLGSVLFSKIISKRFCHVDVCANSPDRNPGAANVFATCGVGIGLLALALDLSKGFLPVFAALHYYGPQDTMLALIMLAPVLGHAVGLFNRFHGGKCIAAAFGVQLALLRVTWVGLILAGLYILFSTIIKIRPNRVRSMVTFALFGILGGAVSVLLGQPAVALGNFLISVTAFVKHMKCFARSSAKGEENPEQSLAEADTTMPLS